MEVLLLTIAVSFVLTLVLGRFVLAELRRLKAGQEIRKEGPQWHAGKAGTPTMGGIMFILGSGIALLILGWKQMLSGEFPEHRFISCGIGHVVQRVAGTGNRMEGDLFRGSGVAVPSKL